MNETKEIVLKENPVYTKMALALAYSYLESTPKEEMSKVYAIAPDGKRISLSNSIDTVRAFANSI